MTIADNKQLKKILSYKKVSSPQIAEIEAFIREYIDPTCQICYSCTSQVQFAFKRLQMWSKANKDEIENTIRKCKVCDEEITNNNKKFCSIDCRNHHMKKVKSK